MTYLFEATRLFQDKHSLVIFFLPGPQDGCRRLPATPACLFTVRDLEQQHVDTTFPPVTRCEADTEHVPGWTSWGGPGERGARLSRGCDLFRWDLPLPERHLLVGSHGAMIIKLLILGSSVAWTTLPKPPDMRPASASCPQSRPPPSAAPLTLRRPKA